MTTILPTQTCFDDAVEITLRRVEQNPGVLVTDEFVIAHAIVRPYSRDMAHAWVETKSKDAKPKDRDEVLFIGILDGERVEVAVDRDEFYASIHVQEVSYYTIRQCVAEEQRTGRCGPWKEQYIKLTREHQHESESKQA